MNSTEFGMVILDKDTHFLKEEHPIDIADEGIFISFKDVHSINAKFSNTVLVFIAANTKASI